MSDLTKFFSAWDVYTTGISTLLQNAGLPDDTEVWHGADGSYAAGDAAAIVELDDTTEYTYAGTVAEMISGV